MWKSGAERAYWIFNNFFFNTVFRVNLLSLNIRIRFMKAFKVSMKYAIKTNLV